MLKAGVAIDTWKLPIFEEALKKAGYNYTNEGESEGMIFLIVFFTDRYQLAALILDCQEKASLYCGLDESSTKQ